MWGKVPLFGMDMPFSVWTQAGEKNFGSTG
jgi:hypothetical protein